MDDLSQQNNGLNCWEFMKCPEKIRKKCDAYKLNCGKDCWFIMDAKQGGPFFSKTNDGCLTCPWFQQNNPELTALYK